MAVNRDKILRAAEKLVQKGKVEQAIAEYEKLLKANPNDANTINRIGDLYGRVGKVDKAIELYEKIADNFTEDGFATKAIAILKKINRLAPQRLDIFNKLADLYMQQGLLVEAQNQFQILADWYAKNEDVAHAIEVHKKLVQLDPNNHMAHLRLADLLMQTGEANEAIAVYDRLGSLLLEREKFDEAERLYRHALEASPPRGDFLAPLCTALLDAGRSAVAREFLTEALRLSPKDHALRVLDVRISLSFGSAEAAKEKADAILSERPKDNSLRELVGKAMISAGQAGEARELLIPAVEDLLAAGDHIGAQSMVQHLIKAMPQDRRVLQTGVRAYEPSGDSEMVFTLKAALADSLFRSSDHDGARAAYDALLKKDPGNKLFRQRLAQLDGGVDQSAVSFEQPAAIPALEPEPVAPAPAAAPAHAVSEFNPKERLAEANVFAKYGLLDKALGHLRQIVERFPDEIEAREKLVLLLLEKGEAEEAVHFAPSLLEHYNSIGDEQGVKTLLDGLPSLAGPEPASVAAPADAADDAELAVEIEEDDEEIIVLEIDEEEFADAELIPERVAEEPVAPGEGAISFDLPSDDEALADAVIDFEGVDEAADDVVQVDADVPDENAAGLVADGDESDLQFDEPEPEPELVFEPEVEVAGEEPVLAAEPESASVPEPPVERPAAPRVRASSVLSAALSELDAIERAVRSETEGRKAPAPTPPAAPREVAEVAVGPPQEEMVEISGSLAGPTPSDLEQTDFYIQQELFEDAIRMLGRLEAEYPNDPEVAERRLLLKSKGVLLDEVPVLDEGPEELFADEEDFFDLAKELEDELAEEEAMVEEATGRSKDEAQLEEVFREFQKGVAEQLSEEDSDTHFNLGIAYKEMGLLPEAIREFQVAARDERMFVECCSMIGVCYVEQGMAGQAAEWYSKALTAPDLVADSRVALSYDLAAALEVAGEVGQALELFQTIANERPGFRDVSQRVVFLSGS